MMMSVGLSVRLISFLSSIQCLQRLFLKTSLVQSRLVQTNLVYSSQIQSNLDNSFLGYFWRHLQSCSGSFQPSLVWSRLVQTNLVYSSQIQTNLVKSSQIQKYLFQAISGSIQRMWWIFTVLSSLIQTSVDQFSLLQSNLVKSRKIFLGYFWQHISHIAVFYSLVQSRLDK